MEALSDTVLPTRSNGSLPSKSCERSAIRATVLLVDDDPDVLHALGLLLRGEPYRLLMAASAREALSCLERRPVDLVVTDEEMPGTRGRDLLAHVAKQWPHVGRIMLTGRPALRTVMRCVNEGRISHFLVKPVAPDELRASLSEALENSARMRACARVLEFAREQLGTSIAPAADDDLGQSPGIVRSRRRFGAINPDLARSLSVREQEVLTELLDGRRPRQIAKHLFVSYHTVRNHLKGIFRKLDVHSQEELLAKCRQWIGSTDRQPRLQR